MKKNIIAYTSLLLCCSSFWACKKQLDVFPTTTEVDGNVIVDAQSATAALNGVYYQFANAGADNNGVPSVLWSSLNEAVPSMLSNMLYNSSGGVLSDHAYSPGSPEVEGIWKYGYRVVNAANGFLKNIKPVTALSDSMKQEMMAEARFLRAYANSKLLLYYGQYYDPGSTYGIILRNGFVSPDHINLPRVSVGACYDSILSDLDNAIAYLPNTSTQVTYADVWAAKLLKARVLINRGASGDYDEVVSMTNDVITNGPFSLEANIQDLFWNKGLNSNEVILGIQPYSNENYKFRQYQYYGQYLPTDTMLSLFNNDPRNTWLYQTVNSPYGAKTQLTKYYPGSVTNIGLVSITENCYALRLTEAYLLESEAIVLSGGDMDMAKTLLKTVMSHAGITDFSEVDAASTPDALHLLIVKEEMRNFVGEDGQDWLAVRRLPFNELQTLIPTLGSKDLLILPIPQTEITANDQMMQNPNY